MRHQLAPAGGFVLAETLTVLVMSTLLVAALLAALIALIRGLQPRVVTIRGEALPVAPSFGAFPSAIRWHRLFSDQVTGARAMYVFGGSHLSLPADAPDRSTLPLKTRVLPAIADFSPGLPMSARRFYELYGGVLGDQDAAASPDDYTIVCVGPANGTLAITALVQVRRTDVGAVYSLASPAPIVREVMLWTWDVPQMQRYAFVEPGATDSHPFVGAVHTWFRWQSDQSVGEEGPTCVVFPDPWLYRGTRGRADDVAPFSRFSYFLPVAP